MKKNPKYTFSEAPPRDSNSINLGWCSKFSFLTSSQWFGSLASLEGSNGAQAYTPATPPEDAPISFLQVPVLNGWCYACKMSAVCQFLLYQQIPTHIYVRITQKSQDSKSRGRNVVRRLDPNLEQPYPIFEVPNSEFWLFSQSQLPAMINTGRHCW